MANYKLSNEADKDLTCLYRWGVRNHGEARADRYYDGMIERFEKIAAHPALYRVAEYTTGKYRRSVYWVHTVYYRATDYGAFIARILRAEDPDASLNIAE